MRSLTISNCFAPWKECLVTLPNRNLSKLVTTAASTATTAAGAFARGNARQRSTTLNVLCDSDCYQRQQKRTLVRSRCTASIGSVSPLPVDRLCTIGRRHSTHVHTIKRDAWTVDPWTGRVTQRHVQQEQPEQQHSYQVIVGLEVHAQLDITTKLFSAAPTTASSTGSRTHYANLPNTRVHPYDAAIPGWYPVVSAEAIHCALLVAGAVSCREIPLSSRFERKHYMYADLPHGYQITQQRWPLARHGLVTAHVNDTDKPSKKSQSQSMRVDCRIHRIQLEQDSGKTTATTHADSTTSRVDLNRAGVALVEIVTEPDMRSSRQASAVVATLQRLLQHSRTSRARLQHGEMRVDVNINVVPIVPDNANNDMSIESPRRAFPRIEVKNLNSIQHVHDCIQYEALRQVQLLDAMDDTTDPLCMETRTWNPSRHVTELIRRKEGDEDYRFLPEPDVPPIVLDAAWFAQHEYRGAQQVRVPLSSSLRPTNATEFVQTHLPELPWAAHERLVTVLGLPDAVARLVAAHVETVEFLDAAMACVPHATPALSVGMANLLCNELFALVKQHNPITEEDDTDARVDTSVVTPQQLATVVQLVDEGQISNTMAKALLAMLYTDCDTNACPRQVVRERQLALVTDTAMLQTLCRTVLEQHPDEVQVYHKGGKFVTKMLKLFTGKVMTASQGKAHPERLQEVLLDCLQSIESSESSEASSR